jgi:hypothetical protein
MSASRPPPLALDGAGTTSPSQQSFRRLPQPPPPGAQTPKNLATADYPLLGYDAVRVFIKDLL